MGKVRIGKVKSVSNELVNKYPTVFTTDFEANKKLVYQYSDIRSKHLNNRVAGYITRLLVSQKRREEALKLEEAEIASKEAEFRAPAMEMTAEAPEEAQPKAAGEAAANEEIKSQGETPAKGERRPGSDESAKGQDATPAKTE